MFETIVLILTTISGFLIIYSHLFFPLILKILRRKLKDTTNNFLMRSYVRTYTYTNLPSITIFVPAHNEGKFIAEKIINLATLDYPKDKLNVIIYCDGCSDNTAEAARDAIYSKLCKDLNIKLIE